MDTLRFLGTILRGEGYYCLFMARNGNVKQKFYDNLSGLSKAAKLYDKEGYDVYFAVSTFTTSASRTAANVEDCSALFVDLDCGEGKPYANQLDAMADLKRFCKQSGMPKPLVVNSGNGVHAYWLLEEPVNRKRWLALSSGLFSLCNTHNLQIDSSVTKDAARVLRVPGTLNHKRGEDKPVVVVGDAPNRIGFDDLTSILPEPKSQPLELSDKVREIAGSALMSILAGNSQSRFRTILKKTLSGKGCEQIRIIATDQKNIEEPLWRAGLSIAAHCVDKKKAIHVISSMHPQYDAAETEAKANRIKGPYLCSKFNEFNPNVCTECPHFGKVKSPIVLGKEIIEADPDDNIVMEPEKDSKVMMKITSVAPTVHQIPQYPKPYFRGKNGGVYVKTIGEDGEPTDELIYHNDIYVVKRLLDRELGESVVIRLHLPKDGVREFTMPLTAVTSKDEFRKHMAMHGVALMKMEGLMKYTLDWIAELQATVTADDARRQFGWTERCESFVVGDREYTPTGVQVNHPSSATAKMFSFFKQEGTLEGWKDMISFYNQPGMELHQLIVCSAFGSPLMRFMPGVNAAGLHIYSKESGFGKTTAMFAAATVWGNYKGFVLEDEDTRNFKMNRGEVYKNLPLYIDEVTNSDPKELSAIAYQLTHGNQRGRMGGSTNDERLRGDPWHLLSVSTGNTSIIERISTYKAMPRAEAQRIMEMRVDEVKFDGKHITDDFNRKLSQNYGHAGPIFIQAILGDMEGTQKLLDEVQRKVDEKLGLTAQNRFWSAWFSCTITGAMIAKRLGLIPFEPAALLREAKRIVNANNESSKAMNIGMQEVISQYVYDNKGSVLEIKSTDDMRNKSVQRNGLDSLIVPHFDPRVRMVARYEPDTNKLFLIQSPLKKWCTERQINYGSLVSDLAGAGVLEKGKVRLGKGTPLNMPAVNCLIIDCSSFNDFDPTGSTDGNTEN